jgi:hypothetical protein
MPDELDQPIEETPQPDAPEPDAPAKEPETPSGDYSPGWLDEPDNEPRQPEFSPEQVDAYYRQMAQYQQQPPRQPVQEPDLDRLVKDTRGTIASIAQEQAYQIAQGVMAQQFGPYAQQMQRFVEGQTRSQIAATDRTLKSMYSDVFNKDEQFVGNSRVRSRVEATLKGMRQDAIRAAKMGDYRALNVFNEPGFAQVALAAAKIVEGLSPTSSSPVSAPHTERAKPASREKKSYSSELDADTIEGLKRLYGSNWEDRYNKSREEEEKYKDFS